MTRKSRLLNYEEKARELFESSISRMLGGSSLPREIVRRLVKQVELSQYQGQVCDQYWIYASAEQYENLPVSSTSFEEDLSRYLTKYVEAAGFSHIRPIHIHVVVDSDAEDRGYPFIVPSCSVEQVEHTKPFQAVKNLSAIEEIRTLDGFLIDGTRHIALDRPTFSIGRHLENDLIIEAKEVSRRHAQIRWRQGRFVIHDLGSKAGLKKNGIAVREGALRPGDVITIGKTSYIYGEGLTPLDEHKLIDAPENGTTQAFDRELS
jgi:hypothetical protein